MTTTTAEQVQLPARVRGAFGKRVRFMRRQGVTPAHLYGKGVSSLSLEVDTAVLNRVLAQVGRSAPVSVTVEGDAEKRLAFVSGLQRDPVTSVIVHVDLRQVSLTEKLRMSVPIVLTGEAPAAKLPGGVLTRPLQLLEVECLPLDLPRQVQVDVSGLTEIGQVIRVADIRLGANVAVRTDSDAVVAAIHFERAEEVKVEAPAEGAVAAEGAPAAEAGAAAKGEAGAKAEAGKAEPAKGAPAAKGEAPAKGEKK